MGFVFLGGGVFFFLIDIYIYVWCFLYLFFSSSRFQIGVLGFF